MAFTETELNFTRAFTSHDWEVFSQAEQELEKQGFDTQSKENALVLIRAFDQSPMRNSKL